MTKGKRKVYVPHPYQKLISDFETSTSRCNIWAGMGMGKTSSTLSHLESEYSLGTLSRPTLVIAPLRVAQSTWPDEAKKWAHLSALDVVPVIGTQSQRAEALREDAPIFTINYENIPWLVDWFKYGPKKWPFGVVVADESTKLKSTRVDTRTKKDGSDYERKSSAKGIRGRALAEVAHRHVDRWINLTGTPAPNGLRDLWGQNWFIDGGAALGRSYTAFEQRWFRKMPGKGEFAPLLPTDNAQDEIQERLRRFTLTVDPADWFDLDAPIVRDVRIELPSKSRKAYREMEKQMFSEINTHGVEALNTGAAIMKCAQMASGAVYFGEEKQWTDMHDAKLQALDSIVEEAAGTPILVAYHWKHDLERILHAFPKARHLDKNPKTIRDWNAGKIPILVAHPDSAGHGLSLQDGGNILVFFSFWWSLESHAQIIERVGPMRQKQAGHNRPVFVYRISAIDTVDEDMLERLEGKRSVQEILLDAMKRRG